MYYADAIIESETPQPTEDDWQDALDIKKNANETSGSTALACSWMPSDVRGTTSQRNGGRSFRTVSFRTRMRKFSMRLRSSGMLREPSMTRTDGPLPKRLLTTRQNMSSNWYCDIGAALCIDALRTALG